MTKFEELDLLTEEERVAMIAALTEEIKQDEQTIEEGIRSDEETELRNDIKYNKEKIDYLEQITPRR